MKLSDFPNEMPAITLDFLNSRQLDPRITFTRASTGTGTVDGEVHTFNTNVPRLTDRGLLIEEARTNKLPRSTFVTGWTAQGAVVGGTTELAPDGSNTAVEISGPNTSGTKSLHYVSNQNGTGVNTFTFYAKATLPNTGQAAWIGYYAGQSTNGGQIAFDLDTGEITQVLDPLKGDAAVDCVYAGSGWWRLQLTLTPDGANNFKWIAGVEKNVGDILIWGAQLEEGGFPTSYIPTAGTTVTRAADVCTITGDEFSSWYNQSEGSFTASVTRPIQRGGRVLSTSSLRYFDFYFAANPLGVGGIYQHNAGSAYQSPTATVTTKFGASLSTNGASKAVNGSGSTYTNNVNIVDVSSLVIGNGAPGINDPLNGPISRISYYPTRLSNDALEALTS